MPKPIIVILFPIVLALSSRAEDWPQWRGSGRDGVWHERGIQKKFPAEGLPVRWRAPVGYGFSSPVVAKGRVYVTDALLDRPKVRGRVLCFEETTGKLLWTFSREKTCVVAFDRKSGTEIWRSLNETAGQASPIIVQAGGRRQLIVWTTQSVSSLDPATGQLFWREAFAAGNSSAVATPVFSNNRLLVSGLMLKLDGRKPSPQCSGPNRAWPREES